MNRGNQIEASRKGLTIHHQFTKEGIDPADTIEWEKRTATITGAGGKKIFEQQDVEVPTFWSQLATNIVASKYFRGDIGALDRESSVRTMTTRVVDQITTWGVDAGYFATPSDAVAFHADISYLILNQYMSFNSPVWFNVGVKEKPQCSACFINSVEDSMDSILSLAKTEGLLFKHGSGTGTNLSTLRSSKELLAGGGTASGPVSFMKGFDAFAGVIKSGGKTRRAAKMAILNVDHPDILEFIRCKTVEEKKAEALIDSGYDGSLNGEAYNSVFFQNANNTVRLTDAFLNAVQQDTPWYTKSVVTKQPLERHEARDIFREIAENAHVTGDPGVQFHDTINSWNTCANSAAINASNPCAEFMAIDDSACNLASLNLMKFFFSEDMDITSFKKAVSLTIIAQDILMDASSYPTKKIAKNSHDFRFLGLGFANLGAVLMSRGLPYDSDDGRAFAAAITSLMTGHAYLTSANIALALKPFEGFELNGERMFEVLRKHLQAAESIDDALVPAELLVASRSAWYKAIEDGTYYGFRNAQVTVLAPTGTIGFMMDCDTTGIEPEMALIKYKKMSDGGLLKLTNTSVAWTLTTLGYSSEDKDNILMHLAATETIEGAPGLKQEHLKVFDCAFKPQQGVRFIPWLGHVKMMAAVQPFLSGAISKTVNLPADATVKDIEDVYMTSWQLGVKAIAVYRDGCKRTQPLTTSSSDKLTKDKEEPVVPPTARRRLPDERQSVTHKFSVGGHEGYLTVGMYEDGTPGELFCKMAKEGSVVSGLVDCFATAISLSLQYGVPLPVLVNKFVHTRFEPSGFTPNRAIPIAKSLADYIFRWLELRFPSKTEEVSREKPALSATSQLFQNSGDAPPCPSCGSIMVRSGACHKCGNCGSTNGCS